MKTTITIKEVAQRSGLSVATVSHVINKNYPVSEQSRRRVEGAVKQLGYEPNLIAGSLRNKKTKTIGLVIPDISNPFFAEFSKCIEAELDKSKYSLILTCSDYDYQKEIQCVKNLLSRMVDGILVVPTTKNGKYLARIRRHTPVVIIDRSVQDVNLDRVGIDGYQGMYNATKYLIDSGHEVFAYIDRYQDHSHSEERRAGFLTALSDHKKTVWPNLIVRSGYSYDESVEAVRTLLEQSPRFTALVTFMDTSAIAAIRVFHDMGIRVPQDISVISFGDPKVCKYIYPSLSAIHYPIEEVSKRTCRLLMERIRNPIYRGAKVEIVPVSLEKRESTNYKRNT